MKHLKTFEAHRKKSRADKLQNLINNWDRKSSEGAVDIVASEVRDAWQNELEELLNKEMSRKVGNSNEGLIHDFKSLYHDYWIIHHNKIKEIEKIIHSDIKNSYIIDNVKKSIIELKQEIFDVERQHRC